MPDAEFFLGIFAGGTFGAYMGGHVVRRIITESANEEIGKYKERWKKALELLHVEGKITDDQLKATTDPHQKQLVQKVTVKHEGPSVPATAANWPSQRELSNMWSADRKKLEIERAEAGLPPADNLKGMWSDDIKKVLQARIKAEAQKKQ